MDAEAGAGEHPGEGAGNGKGGPAGTAAAADAAETERDVGQILDDGLAATGYLPGAAGSAGSATTVGAAGTAGSDAGARALFVLRTLDDVAAPVPNDAGPTEVANEGVLSVDRTVSGMEMAGATLEVNPFRGDRPTDYAARHQRNLAIGGFALIGLFGALLALGGGSGSTPTPAASGGANAASGAAVVASPSSAPSPVATPGGVVLQSAEPSAAASTAPPSAPVAAAQSVTLRGPIDVRAMTKTGLKVGQHDLELVVFLDNGHVTGSFVIAMEEFPIGALLTGTFGGENDPDYTLFKTCTVRLILDGDATGTYDTRSRKLKGKVTFHSVSEDVRDCLRTRPANVSIDPDTVAKPTTVTWSGTFDGSRAKGTLGLTPELAFTATPED